MLRFYETTESNLFFQIWPDNPFTLEVIAVEQCKCANEIVWYFVMVIWKAFLLVISCVWAYQTRHVFLLTINDTQRCGLCAYIIAACSLVGLIIALTTRLLPDVFFGILGLIIIGCVTAVLIILFLHKVNVIHLSLFCCFSINYQYHPLSLKTVFLPLKKVSLFTNSGASFIPGA